METSQAAFALHNATARAPTVHHFLSGSFRSVSLFLLAFSPLNGTISLVQTIDAFGPHQYLATNPPRDRVYTTSWALPSVLSSWEIERPASGAPWRVNHINSVPITATSSYIAIPPPHTHVYSVGGPTGEVHLVDSSTGGFAGKLQQILFVPEDTLDSADKTRAALHYGSHGIEFSPPSGHAFVPVLGTDSIEMYTRDMATGLLTHISSVPSPRGIDSRDGPRHVKVHPNGKILYCVTEHSNYVDVYSITPTSLDYISSRSLLPANMTQRSRFRGDTILLMPSTPEQPTPLALFATTRGSTTRDKGWLSILALDPRGLFSKNEERYETATSGGKANAIDLLPKSFSSPDQGSPNGVWVLLTDDDDSAASPEGGDSVRVLEWDGWGSGGIKHIAGWPSSGTSEKNARDIEKRMAGGSHAIWLD